MGKKSRKKRERRLNKPEREVYSYQERGFSLVCVRIIEWGTYLALFTPLILSGVFFFPFVGPKSLYFMALAEIIFAVYLFLILFSPQYRFKLNIFKGVLIFFMAILILSSIFGADFSNSFWSKYERMTGLLMWFHLLAFFVVISSVFKKEKDWHKIFGVSVFVAMLISLLSLFSKIGIKSLGSAARGGATIGNSSFMAVYLLFNFFLALYLYLKTSEGIKVYSLVGFILIGLALFFSAGRASIGATLGGLVLLGLLWLVFENKGRVRVIGISLLVVFVLGAVSVVSLAFLPGSFVNQKFVQFTSRSRIETAKMAFWGWLEKPLLGWGPENFGLVFCKFFHPSFFLSEYGGEIWFDRVHNIFFDTLITTGILGIFGYFAIFGVALGILWKKYFREKLDFWTVAIFSAILLSYLVQNLTVFDMISSYLVFFLVLGFISSVSQINGEQKRSIKKGHTFQSQLIGIIILILFCFSFLKFIIQPLRADHYVIDTLRAKDLDERLAFYEKALKVSPFGKYQIREFLADSTIRLVGGETEKKVPSDYAKRELDFITKELEKSIQESPLNFKSHLKLGQLYNSYAWFEEAKIFEAERVLIKAIEISPTNQQAYWALAQTMLSQKRSDEAILLAEKAVSLEPRIRKSNLIMIEIARLVGREELAQQKAKEALEINPSWESAIKELLER